VLKLRPGHTVRSIHSHLEHLHALVSDLSVANKQLTHQCSCFFSRNIEHSDRNAAMLRQVQQQNRVICT
jgi:hypothetical protein